MNDSVRAANSGSTSLRSPEPVPVSALPGDDPGRFEIAMAALYAIATLEPKPFEMPADWSAQIDACEECQRYSGHPIQQGICDKHRKPLWDRERHDAHEEKALGYRAMRIAKDAIYAIKEANRGN